MKMYKCTIVFDIDGKDKEDAMIRAKDLMDLHYGNYGEMTLEEKE